jgi:hypothetical protein
MTIETQHQVETHKGVVSLATEAFKYLALANGGGAVVLLSKASLPTFAATALGAFAVGLLACGFAIAAMLAGEMISLHWGEKESKRPSGLAICHSLAIVAVLASSAAFAFGCGAGVGAIEAGAFAM